MLKKLILAAAALAVSAPVLADPPHWARAYGRDVRPRAYYAPPPVYYRPLPPQNGISIRLHFPL